MRQAPTGAPEPRKRSGAYYTPDAVAAMLGRWAVRSAGDRVLDPACGDGRFLTHTTRGVGVEQDAAAAAAARQRAPAAQVCHDEFFAWAQRERAAGSRFDCAVGNPPFIRYQTWSGGVRRRAFALCAELGVVFSGLSASWAPFLVAAAGLLRPGGRLAFVVPAAIGHARYAAPLLEYLVSRFSQVRIVAVRRKLFPRLSEDCWLLFAEGHGGRADAIDLAAVDAIERFETPPAATVRVPVSNGARLGNDGFAPTSYGRMRDRSTKRLPLRLMARSAGLQAKGWRKARLITKAAGVVTRQRRCGLAPWPPSILAM